jgi:DNA-binding NtrC family response regulator
MHPSLQAKLLQVLQDGQFSRLGGQNDVRVDVRILSSTNKNLEEEVQMKRFREDLFYRLNVICIHIPPLRERKEEIPMLVNHFMAKYATHYNKKSRSLYKRTMNLFMKYDWPGNVRELENIVKRILILGNEDAIQQELSLKRGENFNSTVDPFLQENGEMVYSLKEIGREAAKKAEKEAIRSVLEKTHWNRKVTADILKISYKALLYKIKEAGLDKIH